MEWGVEVCVLCIQDLFKEQLDLGLEVLYNSSIFEGAHKVLELREDAVVLSGIEFLLLSCFKKL